MLHPQLVLSVLAAHPPAHGEAERLGGSRGVNMRRRAELGRDFPRANLSGLVRGCIRLYYYIVHGPLHAPVET
jgi:hypothetical protein